jgi:hypothetical protein
MLSMGYGYDVKGIDDRKVNAAKTMVQLAGETALPGALLVNKLPFCDCFLWHWTSSTLTHSSTIHPWMASVVEL